MDWLLFWYGIGWLVIGFIVGYTVRWVQQLLDKPKSRPTKSESRPKADVPRFKADDLVDFAGTWDDVDVNDPDLRRGLQKLSWPARVLYTYENVVSLEGLLYSNDDENCFTEVPARYLKLHTKP